MPINWDRLEAEYITGDMCYSQLGKKYGVSRQTVSYKAKKFNWKSKRREHREGIKKELVQQAFDTGICNAEKLTERLFNTAGLLLDKLEQSIAEANKYLLKSEKVVKTSTKEENGNVETTIKETDFIEKEGIINTAVLKQIASTIKDVRDILGIGPTEKEEETGIIELPERLPE